MLILRPLLEIYVHVLFQIFVLFLTCSEVLSLAGFDASSLADAVKSKLKVSDSVDPDRTFDVGSKLSGLVAGGFDKLGYIPIATAVKQCEGQARYRVEMAINRQVDSE
jgi:hypothetical protein